MIIDILTLFPNMFASPFDESIIARARERKLVDINAINIRDFALDKHQQVDDYPYGGGAGMVMKVDVLSRAIESVKRGNSLVVYLSPQGKRLDQEKVARLAQQSHLILHWSINSWVIPQPVPNNSKKTLSSLKISVFKWL